MKRSPSCWRRSHDSQGDRHELLLLDTNVLVHVARGDDIGSWIVEEYQLIERHERPLLSTVVEAEIRALASYQRWGSRRLKLLADMLSELVRIEVDRAPIIESYVSLYCIARNSGRAIWQSNQNDLWIAATARATGLRF